MQNTGNYLSIGDAARRSGVAASTLRFYETRGLIHSLRVSGNHRRYHRSMLRRISIIRIAQTLGLSLREIAGALETLPEQRTPTKKTGQNYRLPGENNSMRELRACKTFETS